MNKFWVGILVIVAIVSGIFFVGKSGTTDATATPSLTFASVQQAITNGAKFYDVRTAEEFASGHFEKAVNLSLQDIQLGKLPVAPKDTTLYLYCRSGNRSAQAATLLKNAGFTQVIDLGGLSHVESLGGKLITN